MRATRKNSSRNNRRPARGSVLLLVLVTILFAALAMGVFVEKAGLDLMADARATDAARLRVEAYSALEVTLASLEDFISVDGSLHSPAEGWGDPLGHAGYTPPAGLTDTVTFADESGKLSLPRLDSATLLRLFESWQLPADQAQTLTDALMGWMNQNYTPSSATSPTAADYERSALPYDPPYRSLNSFSELAAIDGVRQAFYDDEGRPNDLWRRFVSCVSLYSFPQPDVNAASPDVLSALGYDSTQQQRLSDYLTGQGAYVRQGASYFKSTQDASALLGAPNTGVGANLGVTIRALRITVTVRQGRASFVLSAVVAMPGGGASLPPSGSATPANTGASAAGTNAAPQPPATPPPQKQLNYPFTFLEITENAAMPNPPAAASAAGSS